MSAAVYKDNSGFGGNARLVTFDILDKDLLPDDTWTLTWIEGSWRLWTPQSDGLIRNTTHLASNTEGVITGTQSPMGVELAIEDAPDAVVEVVDPHFVDLGYGRMLFESDGEIWGATTGDYLGDWRFDQIQPLSADDGSWNAYMGGPSVVSGVEDIWMFFDAQADQVLETVHRPSVLLPPSMASTGPCWMKHCWSPAIPTRANILRTPTHSLMVKPACGACCTAHLMVETWSIGHAYSEDLEIWTAEETPFSRQTRAQHRP